MTDSPALLPSEYALSIETGAGRHPKDFAWVAQNVPCRTACPAKTDIPGYLEAIYKGDPAEAYRINLRDNVFPAVLGRTCTRPCEPACRHGWKGLGEPVAICFAKRSADDFQENRAPVVLDKLFPPTDKTVAVVGGGASGLTVARELQLWGHQVTVYERHAEPGGLMIQGIPEFRLPRDTVRREIEQIRLLGVRFECGQAVDAEGLRTLQGQHDAVVLAAGTHEPVLLDCPGADLQGVRHGLEFLKAVNQGERPDPGRAVVVIGGGFTAVDCARMARRLGAADVHMVYRRSEKEMYIGEHELHQFAEEGVGTQFLATPVEIVGDATGNVTAVRFQKTRLVETDGGRARPEPIPGSDFELPCDTVLLGTGQKAAGWWQGLEGLHLAGDAITGPGSLIDAIGHGKKIAREVDQSLMGQDRFETVVVTQNAKTTGRTREMDLLPRLKMPEIPADARGVTDEVETGLSREDAETEASRCYLCHYKFEIDNDLCIYCDRCLKVKPVDDCIVKISDLIYDDSERITGYVRSTGTRNYNRLHLDQNQCIRCGACVEVCPVECITLQKVSEITLPRK
ncbi:MAG: FAD-dependent oxidoreductase [Verrucomicrobia bacterium]|nr:FAD-dependent oxidoreductase [Verrucomicrobiota bacterium]MCH8510482.1 FAD-dependent oxidoreductase [Kiritimatiellia bacterium]